MCSNKNNCRNRNKCQCHNKHKRCDGGSKSDPVPTPKPEPVTPIADPNIPEIIHRIPVIPVVPMDQLPGPNTLKNGTMYLVGAPMSITDPQPDARKYQLAVSNGDYYFAFSPN